MQLKRKISNVLIIHLFMSTLMTVESLKLKITFNILWKERRKRKDSQKWNRMNNCKCSIRRLSATTEKLLLIIYCVQYLTSVAVFDKFRPNIYFQFLEILHKDICKFRKFIWKGVFFSIIIFFHISSSLFWYDNSISLFWNNWLHHLW